MHVQYEYEYSANSLKEEILPGRSLQWGSSSAPEREILDLASISAFA